RTGQSLIGQPRSYLSAIARKRNEIWYPVFLTALLNHQFIVRVSSHYQCAIRRSLAANRGKLTGEQLSFLLFILTEKACSAILKL
ncbi:MAG: hypothetical protein ABS900_07820, partial [Candidatus Limivicinus sp.]